MMILGAIQLAVTRRRRNVNFTICADRLPLALGRGWGEGAFTPRVIDGGRISRAPGRVIGARGSDALTPDYAIASLLQVAAHP
jgi:hypothetical protein